LYHFGIEGQRSEVNNGVWIGSNKISAVGISVSHWITYHGLAVNIDCDMSYFDSIVPCGIKKPECGVMSLRQINQAVQKHEVIDKLLESFHKVFNVEIEVSGYDCMKELDDISKEYFSSANVLMSIELLNNFSDNLKLK